MSVYDINGHDLQGDTSSLEETVTLGDSFVAVDSTTDGSKKLNAYKYFGDSISGKYWKTDYLANGKYTEEPFVAFFVNDETGNDSNEGSSTHPVKTINKAMELGFKTGNEFRIALGSGSYSLTGRTITGACIHIFASSPNTSLTLEQMAFYNCHINFQGSSSNKFTILCSDLSKGWYADDGLAIFKYVDMNCHYSQNAGACYFDNCIIHDVKVNYADSRLINTSIGNSLGRTTSIYEQQGGSLYIDSGFVCEQTQSVDCLLNLKGVFANIRCSKTGNSSFTTGINIDGSQIISTSTILSSYGSKTKSNGGYMIGGGTVIN